MDLYQRQQFDFFLQTATERYVARLQERFRGPEPALKRVKDDPMSQEVGLLDFVEAVFQDFLLDNPEGACFVLQALCRKPMPQLDTQQKTESVQDYLVAAAKKLFTDLMLQKTIEVLEQQSTYQAVQMGDH